MKILNLRKENVLTTEKEKVTSHVRTTRITINFPMETLQNKIS